MKQLLILLVLTGVLFAADYFPMGLGTWINTVMYGESWYGNDTLCLTEMKDSAGITVYNGWKFAYSGFGDSKYDVVMKDYGNRVTLTEYRNGEIGFEVIMGTHSLEDGKVAWQFIGTDYTAEYIGDYTLTGTIADGKYVEGGANLIWYNNMNFGTYQNCFKVTDGDNPANYEIFADGVGSILLMNAGSDEHRITFKTPYVNMLDSASEASVVPFSGKRSVQKFGAQFTNDMLKITQAPSIAGTVSLIGVNGQILRSVEVSSLNGAALSTKGIPAGLYLCKVEGVSFEAVEKISIR